MAAAAAKTTTTDLLNTREPIAIVARGTDLLAMIAAAPGGYLFLTQDEGADIVSSGNAVVIIDPVAPDGLATVTLTDAGKAVLAALPPVPVGTPPAAAPKLTLVIRNDVPLPVITGRSRGRASQYKFDIMAVGESFWLPKTAANPDPVGSIASSLTGARLKYAVPEKDDAGNPVMETVKEAVYEKGADGKRVKVDGHFVKTGEIEVQKAKLNFTRDFVAASVDATDPDGEGARVWRSK